MDDRTESVHVHKGDARDVIKDYEDRGFVLIERTTPSVAAQMGFVKLVFAPADDAPAAEAALQKSKAEEAHKVARAGSRKKVRRKKKKGLLERLQFWKK